MELIGGTSVEGSISFFRPIAVLSASRLDFPQTHAKYLRKLMGFYIFAAI
jgi:hypothetical protein